MNFFLILQVHVYSWIVKTTTSAFIRQGDTVRKFYLTGRRRRFLYVQGNEQDSRFFDLSSVPGGPGGRGGPEEPVEISGLL